MNITKAVTFSIVQFTHEELLEKLGLKGKINNIILSKRTISLDIHEDKT